MSKPEGEELDKLFDEQWKKIDEKDRQKIVAMLQSELPEEFLAQVRDGVAKHGHHEWIGKEPFSGVVMQEMDDLASIPIPYNFHHGPGMRIRNLLRHEGFADAMLPPFDAYYGEGTDVRNWDDVYVQAIEAAAGARDV